MKITSDMFEVLNDLYAFGDGRGPSSTGLYLTTYKALQRRGLVTWEMDGGWRLTDAGRAFLRVPTAPNPDDRSVVKHTPSVA